MTPCLDTNRFQCSFVRSLATPVTPDRSIAGFEFSPITCLDRLWHTVCFAAIHRLSGLLDFLQHLLVGKVLVGCDISCLALEGDVVGFYAWTNRDQVSLDEMVENWLERKETYH